MIAFNTYPLRQSTVLYLYSTRSEIQIDPDYQRPGDVWTVDKRQLLIDSIINGFDIPKIYFHQVSRKRYKYAIVDGRQRLESVWGFVDGQFPLGDDFEYLKDDKVKAAGLTYSQLGQKYPRVKAEFDATSLSVYAIQTDDLDLIEDMFSRLNEAVPLNAAEKRNAFGGPAPKAIRQVANFPFFKRKVSISDKRYKHRDVAAKFLYLVHEDEIADTKKVYLDQFVRSFRGRTEAEMRPLIDGVRRVLRAMEGVFVDKDSLLKSQGMVVLYFLLFKDSIGQNWMRKLTRANLEKFERARNANRVIAEKDITSANYSMLEFDRYSQTPNDAYAMRLRLRTLKEFLKVPTDSHSP